MERAKTRRKHPLWLRIALGLMIVVGILVASAVALRFWITSDSGRAFILSQIDGRKVGPLGTIRLSGLKGDPLDAATLADIALIDDEGVWLRARDAEIKWTPTALFAGELEIKSIDIRTVDVLRKPRLAMLDENQPGPDIGLRLDTVAVDDLHLAAPVIGIEARYRIDGGAARPRDGSGFARLTLSPVQGPADKANLAAKWSNTGGLTATAALSGPPGGLIAAMLQSPTDQSVAFIGDVTGTMDKFSSNGLLTFADKPVANFVLARSGDIATLTAHADVGTWPLLAAVAERAGGPVDIQGAANLANIEQAPVTLNVTAPAGVLTATTLYDFKTFIVPMEFQTRGSGLDLAILAPPLAGTVDATGVLRMGVTGVEWTGEATGAKVAWPSGNATRLSSTVAVNYLRSQVGWEATNTRIDGARIDALPSLAPARYTGAARGEVNLRTGLVEIYASQIEGAPGSVSARGSYNTRSGAMDFQGAARVARLSDVAPLTGRAQGRWRVRAIASGAPIRIAADMEGRDVGSANATLAELAGPAPRVVLAGVVSKGRFAVESGSFQGQAVRANVTGRVSDNGAIAAHATGVISRKLDLGGAIVETAAFNADISGDVSRQLVNLHLTDGAITAGGVRVHNLAASGEARLSDAATGRFSLTGDSDVGPFKASGQVEAGEGDWRILNLAANLGDLKFNAPRLGYSDGALAMAFTASGPLAGIAGLEKGALNASGNLRFGEELLADVNGRITDIRTGGLRLDLVSFAAKASGGKAAVEAHAVGKFGAPIDMTITANAAQQGASWSGDAVLKGTVDQLPIASIRPALWQYGPDGWKVDSAISALRGEIELAIANLDSTATAHIEMRRVNLRGLSRLARITPIQGTISGTGDFSNGAGPATGNWQLNIADANPVGVTADPVTLTFQSNLNSGVVVSTLKGAGQGFSLDASSRLPVIDGEGFDVMVDSNRQMQNQLELHGRAEQLWALFGPEDQSLRGNLDASINATGTLAQPILAGGIDVADGAYEHAETGLSLRAISAHGAFDQNSARITNLSANDGHGGTLTGDGNLSWNGAVQGGVTFKASDLRVLGRDDRLAVVSGDGKVNLGDKDLSIAGAFTISQARISIEQPASASIPTIPGLRRTNFPNHDEDEVAGETPPWLRPAQLDLKVTAPRRIVVFGRGLDTEWGANLHITGPLNDPSIAGTATMVRGDLDLAGRRFQFDTGTITLDGPIRMARIDISADRTTSDITASVRITGTPVEPKFALESTPALPQDEVLARVLFGRSVTQLSGFEAAQLAAGLAQLAGGQAGFDPVGLVRKATGLDRVSFGAEEGIATVSAGKYVAENVYVQVGSGGAGGVGAEVEWEPTDSLSIISSADGNGDTKIAVRWKKDY